MDEAHSEQVQGIFHHAGSLKGRQRDAFLEQACCGDAALLTDVRGHSPEVFLLSCTQHRSDQDQKNLFKSMVRRA
jgi:hypothetical protein